MCSYQSKTTKETSHFSLLRSLFISVRTAVNANRSSEMSNMVRRGAIKNDISNNKWNDARCCGKLSKNAARHARQIRVVAPTVKAQGECYEMNYLSLIRINDFKYMRFCLGLYLYSKSLIQSQSQILYINCASWQSFHSPTYLSLNRDGFQFQ
jgi:hypothetical protein